MWGVEGKDGVDPERLKPLGLYCSGGFSRGNVDYLNVWCNNKRYELTRKEFDNIEIWLRKIKLNKINEKAI